jgi:hypothetical protein
MLKGLEEDSTPSENVKVSENPEENSNVYTSSESIERESINTSDLIEKKIVDQIINDLRNENYDKFREILTYLLTIVKYNQDKINDLEEKLKKVKEDFYSNELTTEEFKDMLRIDDLDKL